MPAPASDVVALDYEVRGTGNDAILFVSGTNDDRDGWAENVPAFETDYRCILFDNRDVGASPRTEDPYAIADMARDAMGVLDRAGTDRAHVMGHSMGGLIAQEIAIRWPERVKSLVLVGTFPKPDPFIASALAAWKTNAQKLTPAEFARASMYFWVGETMINTAGPDALIEMIAPLIEAQGVDAFCRQVDAVLDFDASDRLGSITAPTLVVWGVEDKIALEHHSRALLEGINGAQYARIEGSGHCPTFEQPSVFNEVVRKFLERAS